MVVDLAQCSPQEHPKKEGRGDLSSISCLISAKSRAFSLPSSFLNPMACPVRTSLTESLLVNSALYQPLHSGTPFFLFSSDSSLSLVL